MSQKFFSLAAPRKPLTQLKAVTWITRSAEGALRWQMTLQWQLGVAARNDSRTTTTTTASSLLSENGNRTDLQGRVHYRPQLQATDGTFLKPANWDLSYCSNGWFLNLIAKF